ncbi:hypothetical protein VNO78_07436 [Psophocarpus tetragonolobus]|uniref:Uncharacterized protein n=1 Tax=Psophocarpus tetragonolobus TaxID=3891 RepID=A0AAN9SV96_PSOTE
MCCRVYYVHCITTRQLATSFFIFYHRQVFMLWYELDRDCCGGAYGSFDFNRLYRNEFYKLMNLRLSAFCNIILVINVWPFVLSHFAMVMVFMFWYELDLGENGRYPVVDSVCCVGNCGFVGFNQLCAN